MIIENSRSITSPAKCCRQTPHHLEKFLRSGNLLISQNGFLSNTFDCEKAPMSQRSFNGVKMLNLTSPTTRPRSCTNTFLTRFPKPQHTSVLACNYNVCIVNAIPAGRSPQFQPIIQVTNPQRKFWIVHGAHYLVVHSWFVD